MRLDHYQHVRREASAAGALIERMQPDTARRWWCLALLADAIQAAHRANPERWGVTLFTNRARLNVGMIEVCFFDLSDHVYLALDAATLATAPAARPALSQEASARLASYPHGGWAGPATRLPERSGRGR